MADYKQNISCNPNVPGRSGYCLVYARTSFGIASKYGTASLAWANAAFKHGGTPPSNVSVPIFFKWKSDGHVADWVKGKIYSTTAQGVKTFATIDALAKYISGTYLGWSEDLNGRRIVQPVAAAPSTPVSKMPTVGSRIQLIPTQTRTTFKAGTANVAGHIRVTDYSFIYVYRGEDPKYPGRAIINSASAGGNGVGLALYYLNGTRIDGWKQL